MKHSSLFPAIISIMLLCIAGLLLLSGCASTSDEIPRDLEPIEYFQQAQKIADGGDYVRAISYYRTFIERYPEDLQRIVIAKYEIAFLNYKRGRYNLAMQQFDELLTYYEDEGSAVLPRWPKILSEKVQTKIRELQQNPQE